MYKNLEIFFKKIYPRIFILFLVLNIAYQTFLETNDERNKNIYEFREFELKKDTKH